MDDFYEEHQAELKLQKDKGDQLATQIEGLILCLKKHGSNINTPFLIDHYETVLKKYRNPKPVTPEVNNVTRK